MNEAVSLPGTQNAGVQTLQVSLGNLKPGEAQFAMNIVALMCEDRPEYRKAFEDVMGGRAVIVGEPNGALSIFKR